MSVTVSVKQGALRGSRCKTARGTPYVSFLGVPYAKPPVGELRFKAPEPVEQWTGIRDATKLGNQCVHVDPFTKQLVGDEDCLFLNVFTPHLPGGRGGEGKPRAVLFWIHGGGFANGSSDMYGPEPLVDQDIVLVTINYRVGPLGFLALGNLDAPGNAGLKDQTMALRWVKENIATFGGDPHNVTIFGESAGGASVHYQVLSPLTKGLFGRAIAQSGSAFCRLALTREPLARAKHLALAAGCDSTVVEDTEALSAWLREVPAVELVRAVDSCITAEERRRDDVLPFVPVVEPVHTGAFLPDDPQKLLASGLVPRTPIVFGLTSHEGIFFLPGPLMTLGFKGPELASLSGDAKKAAEAKALMEVASDLERVLPQDLLQKKRDLQRSRKLVEKVKDFYFGGKQLTEETLPGYVDLQTDLVFGLGVVRAAREHARLGAPVFLYEFAFRGALNFLGMLLGCSELGVCHGDEIGYQFGLPGLPEPEEGSPEALTRQRMGRLWTDFARSGNPTPAQDTVITTKWLPYTESDPNYLVINEDLKLESGLWKDRMHFWTDLYKL